MSAPAPLDTLFLPFDDGFLDWNDDTLFIGADVHSSLQLCDGWQVWKPAMDRLSATKVNASNEFTPAKKYQKILIHLPKQVQEAKGWIAMALSVLSEGGMIVASAANDAGGSRLVKWLEEAGCKDIRSESKNKSRVVWTSNIQPDAAVLDLWKKDASVRAHDFGGGLSLYTQPGLFSWDRIDKASRLLTENLPPALAGHGADLGCGYGYLSHTILKEFPKVKSLSLVEADSRALDCAIKNVEDVRHDRPVSAFWHDATKIINFAQPLDFVVMNPPFHTGKKTDVDLGQSFIRTAAAVLKKGGNLSLVANNHLPYETLCESLFKNVKIVVQKDGFKVIRAVK